MLRLVRIALIALGFALALRIPGAHASNPDLTRVGAIADGSASLTVECDATPVVVDWNNDGARDLLVGDYYGYVHIFLNKGTNAAPVFNGGACVESEGVPICLDGFG